MLVAEDNDINAHVAEQYLKSMGYKVSRVRDGQQAIDLCSDPNNQYDAILMDINMPKVDGYEATKVLREKLRLTIPIIALTANAFEEDIKKSLAIGMNKHLVKPFDKEDLQLVLRSLLAENETTN
ncbi:response regulator [Psychrosphaera sp. G1-22]|uniref:Response regulator n=1 Tax=Psychrosphaera algicola TaxID=3023714 RepID=A0ABT5FG00_9GAMM|nr:response regulator [Psychrosphaera sp. G1-22]MDC2889974.1 response regulator [Psychrosphaera sp. G1-22]